MHPRLLVAPLLLLAACANVFSERERLLLAVREYNDGVRWGRLDQSVSRLPAELRQRFLDRRAALADELDITDCDISRIDVERDQATVTVDISWALKRRGIVERTIVSQDWRRRRGDWILTTETRLRGVPLTLYDEPAVAAGTRVASEKPRE